MRILSDNRAQSIQVGAVLLFGVFIVFLALWQSTVVPDQNEEIEFDHNEEVQEQMTELRSTLASMPGTANTRSTSVNLGVRYPSRTIFVNPPSSSGTLETIGTTDSDHNITISGAVNASSEPVGVESFWDGSNRSYNTGSIVYRPGYNEYTNAPRTILEHSVVLNDFGNRGSLPVNGEALFDDDDGRMTLVAVNGSLSENRVGRAAVDVKPKSTDTQLVELEPAEDEDEITVELPIEAGDDGWGEALEDLNNTAGITTAVSDGVVTIEIDDDDLKEGFDLELAKVGVGTGATGTDAAYIRDATNEDGTATVTEGETKDLTVEVRDDYNNPKRGVSVNASVSEGSVEDTKETNRNGKATFEYNASGVDPGEDEVDFSITEGYEPDAAHDSDAPENITITVTVEEESSTGEPATQLPGPKAENLTYNETEVKQGDTIGIDEARFNNTGTTEENRGGVPVVGGEYYVVKGSVDNPEEAELKKPDPDADDDINAIGEPDEGDGLALDAIPIENRGLIVSTTGTIETDDLDAGNYTTFIRGQDTRGIWTDESEDGFFGESFEVQQATLEIQDFSNELPDGETEPVEAGEEITVEVSEIGNNRDAEDVDITLTIEERNTGERINLDQETFTETIVAGETESVTFETAEDIEAGDYNATVIAENSDVNGDERTESFTVLEDDRASLEIQDFSEELPDGETEPVEAGEEITVEVTETTGETDADNVDITLTIEERNTGERINLDQETFTETIVAGETEPVPFETAEDIEGGDYNATVIAENGDVNGDERTESFTVLEEGQANLEIQDFSDELPDGETVPVDLEDVDVAIEETAGVDADDVNIEVEVFDSEGDPVDDATDSESAGTINANEQETVTFFQDEDAVEVFDADTYDVRVDVTAENADATDRTERFTAEPAEIDSIQATDETTTAGEQGSIDVTAEDEFGNNVDDFTIEVQDAGGIDDLEGASESTEDGTTTFTFTENDADDYTVTFELEGDAETTATSEITVEPAEIDNIQATDETTTAGDQGSIDVTAEDEFGNAVDEFDIEVQDADGIEDLEDATASATDGTAEFTFTEEEAGDYTVILELEGDTDTTDTSEVTVEPAEPDSIEVVPAEDTATADGADELSYTATVSDEFGNTIEGVPVETSAEEDAEDIEFNGDDSLETDANGEVEVTVTSTNAQEDVTFTFEEQENNNQATATGTFEAGDVDTVNADFAEEEVPEGEGNVNELSVSVTDANENPIEGEDVTLSVEQGDGQFLVDGNGEGDTTTVVTDEDGELDVDVAYEQGAGDEAGDTITVEAEADGATGEASYEVAGPEPTFESLNAEVDDYNQGQDVIREVNVDGSVENVDDDGFIEIEFLGDVEDVQGDTERQIGMTPIFDEDFDTGGGGSGPSELGVIVRLLDGDEDPYVTCTSDDDALTDGNSELTIDDFTCG